MDRKTRWRTFWLGMLTLLAICVLVPSFVPSKSLPIWFNKLFNKKIQLGLDLQGGLYIVYSIDLNKAVDDKASELKRDIEAKLGEVKIEGRVTTPATPVGAVNIIADNPADRAKLDGKFLSDYDEYVVKRKCPQDIAQSAVCVRVSSSYADGIREAALDQAITTIRKRINHKGLAEPSVKKKGYQIIVELPGLDDEKIAEVKDIIARTAKLEFKMVEDSSDYMKRLYGEVDKDEEAKKRNVGVDIDYWSHEEKGTFKDWFLKAENYDDDFTIAEAKERGCWNRNKREFQGKVKCTVTGREVIEKYLEDLYTRKPDIKIDDDHEIGFEWIEPRGAGDNKSDPYWRTYYLRRAVELGGSAIDSAVGSYDPQSNRPVVLVDFDRYGSRRFGDMTKKNVGKKMAIILDTAIISAPTIQSAIMGGRTMITMGGGGDVSAIEKERDNLVTGLKTGSLPAPLQEESSAVIGPLLGRDAVAKAQFSFILGSVLVILIMVWIYRFSGMISIFGLVLNLLFMMAILATFGATLTLPGIAALVLTVGMAVDANIIIYERVREELRTGKSIRGAVDAGFSRGFAAIFDGQLTTGVAAYVLMQYGSGPIRGFAVMLIIGIICTLFTTTWCARLFFEHYVGKGRKVSKISI